MKTLHHTLKFKKSINESTSRVFKAFASTKEKSLWSTPEGDAIVFEKQNFKVNGTELFKCGPRENLRFRGQVIYLDIVKNERIVYVETISHSKKKLASAIITIELFPDKDKTNIFLKVQIVSFVGSGFIKGCNEGYKASLSSLKKYLEKQ